MTADRDAECGTTQSPSVLLLAGKASAEPRYARPLRRHYPTASTAGETASSALLDRDHAVVFHDRDEAELSRRAVLRASRTGRQRRRLVTTAPDLPAPEPIERGFDEVLPEPLSSADALAAVERQLERARYTAGVGRLFELCRRRARYVDRRPDAPEPRLATASLDRVIRAWKRRTERRAAALEPAEATDLFSTL